MWTERRRLVVGLLVSLLVNVFLIGIVVGRSLALHHPPPSPPGPGPLIPRGSVQALPEDQRRIFQAAMVAHREAIRAARRDHRELLAKIESDIAAPTFDRAAVEADFAALHNSNRAIEEATSAALLDALTGLSASSRAAVVQRAAAAPGSPKL